MDTERFTVVKPTHVVSLSGLEPLRFPLTEVFMTDNESLIDITSDTIDNSEVGAQQEIAMPEQRMLPGMDITKIVYDEAIRLAGEGTPPAYCFMRNDIYTLLAAANSAPGIMRWVNPELSLDCYIIPFFPRGDQNPIILAHSYEQAQEVVIASFPEGTFTFVTPEGSAQGQAHGTTKECDVPSNEAVDLL